MKKEDPSPEINKLVTVDVKNAYSSHYTILAEEDLWQFISCCIDNILNS